KRVRRGGGAVEGEGRLVPALVAEALRSSGALSAFPTFEVVSAYTHLVLRCRPPAGGPGWILKFWRNGSRRPIDAYAHRLLRRRIPVPTIVSSGRVRVPETGCLTLRFPVVRGESIAFTLYEEIENAEPASRWESRWPETMR